MFSIGSGDSKAKIRQQQSAAHFPLDRLFTNRKFIFYCPEIEVDLVKLFFMKTAVSFATVFCLILFSCSKKSQDGLPASVQPDQLISATVNSGQTYTFMAGSSGTLTVTRQALHYQFSATATDEKGSVIYSYTPRAGYIGADDVELMYSTAAAPTQQPGGCPSHNSDMTGTTNIVIKFNVTK